MKKTVLLAAFTLLSICTVLAQDSSGTTTTKTHKKSMHSGMHRNGNSGMDSVNAGKVTTNPQGKMGSKRKTRTSSSSGSSSSTDSAR